MKAKSKKCFRFAACCALALGVCLVLTAGPALAAPVVMQADLGDRNGTLYDVALDTPHGSPWTSDDTTLSQIGSQAGIEYNNIGYRDDGWLYGVEIFGNGTSGSNGNVVRINPATGATSTYLNFTALSGSVRWDAGDVNNDDDVMYITNTATVNTLYTLDFATGTLSGPITITNNPGVGYVADWAYYDGFLYGMDQDGKFVRLNPTDGSIVKTATTVGASGVAYGAAWADPDTGIIYAYRNEASDASGATIYAYSVDGSGTPTLVDRWGATGSPLHDGAYLGPEAVPIPGAALLLGSGLIGLAFVRRRFKS